MQVLIVDDHSAWCEGICALLQPFFPGFQFQYRTSARDALTFLSQQPCPVDLLLLDASLPEISGSELQQQLLQQEVFLPVIVLSGSNDPQLVRQLLTLGVSGFIPKHFSVEQIATAMQHCLDGQIFLPDETQQQLQQLDAQAEQRQQIIEALQITPKELEVLEMMEQGLSNQQIAATLTRAPATVKTHINRLYSKLSEPQFNVANRQDCLYRAWQLGIFAQTSGSGAH